MDHIRYNVFDPFSGKRCVYRFVCMCVHVYRLKSNAICLGARPPHLCRHPSHHHLSSPWHKRGFINCTWGDTENTKTCRHNFASNERGWTANKDKPRSEKRYWIINDDADPARVACHLWITVVLTPSPGSGSFTEVLTPRQAPIRRTHSFALYLTGLGKCRGKCVRLCFECLGLRGQTIRNATPAMTTQTHKDAVDRFAGVRTCLGVKRVSSWE